MTSSKPICWKPICWIASYPKSGNTWVRMFLHAYAAGELNINRMRSSTGDKQTYFWQTVAHRDVNTLTPTEIVCLRSAMLCHLIEANPVRPLLVKTHHCNALVDDYPLIPSSLTDRAVYVVRDPRDVCLSYASHFKVDVDSAIESMGDEGHQIGGDDPLKHYVSSWTRHIQSWLSEKDYPVALIKYERMLDSPREVFGKLIEFMGQELNDDRLDRAIELTSFKRVEAQEIERGFIEKPHKDTDFFRKGKAGQWRTELTDSQTSKLERQHGPMMDRLGYSMATAKSQRTKAA